MPFYTPDPNDRSLRLPLGQDDPPARFDPYVAPIAPAFRQSNPFVSWLANRHGDYPPEPGYSPLPDIEGTDYFANHRDRFLGSRSSTETESIKAQIDMEEADRRAVAANGAMGTVLSMAAGTLDPTILFPAGATAHAVEGGIAVGRTALRTGAAFGAQVAAQEFMLHGTQETRTPGESAVAIGSATLLGAVIGGGAAALLSRADREALTRSLDAERNAAAAHAAPAERAADNAADNVVDLETVRPGRPGAAGEPPNLGVPGERPEAVESPAASSGLSQAAGAAPTDTRALEPVGYLFNRIPGWSRFAHLIGTDLGIYSSASNAAKRAFSQLAETTLRFKQNLAGEVTSPVVPLSREVDLWMHQSQIKVQDETKRLYSEYFFGQPDMTLPYVRAEAALRGGPGAEAAEGKLAPADFAREVSSALQQGDRHAIPQVEQAAQYIRRTVLDPWARRMEAANPNFKIQEFGPGESYFPFRYLHDKIAAERPQFIDDVITPYLEADQASKAAAKARMQTLVDDMAATRRDLEKATEETAAALDQRMTELRGKIEDEIAAWEGKSAAEAKAAIRAREKYRAEAEAAGKEPGKGGRLTGADDAIDRAVQRIIESDRDLSRQELRAKASEITDHILGTPVGRIPYDIAATANANRRAADLTARGPLRARDFAIPYAMVRDYLDHDLDRVLGSWMRTMVPDTLLWERFPGEGPAINSVYRAIQDEYDALVRERPKSAKKLNDEKDRVIATIGGTLDRVRGVANNTIGMSGRIGEAVRRLNQMTDLGFAGVTSIPDMGGAVLFHGLTNVFRDGWAPLFKYLSTDAGLAKMSRRELRDTAIAIEIENATRGHALAETSDAYAPRTAGERLLKAGSDRFFLLNAQALETNVAKRIAGRVAMAQMLRATEAEAAGKATQKQITMLREANISPALSERIWKQFSATDGGSVIEGTPLPNTSNWTDETARMHFLAAVARDVDRAVVTPGAEKPLWLSSNVGALLGQYKSFGVAATNKMLISNIQRADAATLQGVLSMVALGMMSYKLTALARGQKTPDRPQDWVKEGINRSGLFGALEDVNMFLGKSTRGRLDAYRLIGADKPLSRNANRTILSSLLGPTAGKIENITRVTGAAAAREWNEGDTSALRRLIALQNTIGLNRLFDGVEHGVNHAFGIPMKARPQ